jgi:nucleotide-binding universal stress UspA family protein
MQKQDHQGKSLRLAVAFDDSPAGWGGLRYAAELARGWGWSVIILHAALPDVSTFEYGLRTLPKYEDARTQASRLLTRAQATVCLDIPTTTEVLSGDPGIVVPTRAAELEANILVIGSSRRGALDRMLFGSVGEAILRRASSPVLIVPVQPERATAK